MAGLPGAMVDDLGWWYSGSWYLPEAADAVGEGERVGLPAQAAVPPGAIAREGGGADIVSDTDHEALDSGGGAWWLGRVDASSAEVSVPCQGSVMPARHETAGSVDGAPDVDGPVRGAGAL